MVSVSVAFTIEGRLPSLNDIISACRTHHYAGAAQKKQAERDILPQIPPQQMPHRFNLHLCWHCPNSRRDPDNIAAGVKFILDSLQTAGTIPNDGWGQVASIHHTFEIADRDYVEVRLEDA